MPNLPGTTNKQTLFLRAFRNHESGPPPEMWPSPSILRKWLRKPGFIKALRSVQEALRFQTDFHLTNAAKEAARKFSAQDSGLSTQDLNRLLRHAHLRQRFPAADQHAEPTEADDPDEDAAEEPKRKKHPLDDFYRCEDCNRRRRNPFWVHDEEAFKQAARSRGYVSPLRDWPDFPDPVPQDTFYYSLVRDTRALLWYMHRYDKSGDDHRYQPILIACKHLLPNQGEDYLPHFASQRQKESAAAAAENEAVNKNQPPETPTSACENAAHRAC
jgi:hypothetical protein